MLLNMFEQNGHIGRIDGEFLQGGMGELQAIGLVKVLVEDRTYDSAKKLLDQWEQEQPRALSSEKKQSHHFSNGFAWFFVGLAFGTGLGVTLMLIG